MSRTVEAKSLSEVFKESKTISRGWLGKEHGYYVFSNFRTKAFKCSWPVINYGTSKKLHAHLIEFREVNE